MNILILILILFLVVFLLSITNKEDFINFNFKLIFKPQPELDETYMRCFHINNQTTGSLVIFMQMTTEFKKLFDETRSFNPKLPSDGSEQYDNWDWLTKQDNVHGQFEGEENNKYFTSFVLCELEQGKDIKIVLPLIKTTQGVGNIYERPDTSYSGWGLEGCRLWGIKNNSPLLFKYSDEFSASVGQRVLWSSPDFKNTTKFEFTFQTLKPDINTDNTDNNIIGDAFNLSIIPDPCGSGHFNENATAFYTQQSVNYGNTENDFSFNFNEPNLAKLGCNYDQTAKECVPGQNIKDNVKKGDCVKNTCSIADYDTQCRLDLSKRIESNKQNNNKQCNVQEKNFNRLPDDKDGLPPGICYDTDGSKQSNLNMKNCSINFWNKNMKNVGPFVCGFPHKFTEKNKKYCNENLFNKNEIIKDDDPGEDWTDNQKVIDCGIKTAYNCCLHQTYDDIDSYYTGNKLDPLWLGDDKMKEQPLGLNFDLKLNYSTDSDKVLRVYSPKLFGLENQKKWNTPELLKNKQIMSYLYPYQEELNKNTLVGNPNLKIEIDDNTYHIKDIVKHITYTSDLNSSDNNNNYNENSKGTFTLHKSRIQRFIDKTRQNDEKKYSDDNKFQKIIGYEFTFYDLGKACNKDTSFTCI